MLAKSHLLKVASLCLLLVATAAVPTRAASQGDAATAKACQTIQDASDPSAVPADVIRLCNTDQFHCQSTIGWLAHNVPGLRCGLDPAKLEQSMLDNACSNLVSAFPAPTPE
jgi:hypothetical protein